MTFKVSLSTVVVLALAPVAVVANMEFGTTNVPVSSMLDKHALCISDLKARAAKIVPNIRDEPYCNDVFYLRFCLSNDYQSDQQRLDAFHEILAWRQENKKLCDAARAAASEATKDGQWDYDPIHRGIPNSIISKHLTPSKVLTTFTPNGDVVFCMQHGEIDDRGLMKSLSSQKDVVDFMIYAKEVNAIVANQRSLTSDRLKYVLTANNMKGASLATGSPGFRAALQESALLAARLYPSLTGPTLMLNLPSWLKSVAKAFTPAVVANTLTFAQGPLQNVKTLMDIATDGPQRAEFLSSLNDLVYNAL